MSKMLWLLLWAAALVLPVCGTLPGNAGLEIGFIRPRKLTVTARSLEVVVRHNRNIHALTNVENDLAIIVQLNDRIDGKLYGRARVILQPNNDAVRLEVPIRNGPLPVQMLKGVCYVTPEADSTFAARIAVVRFDVEVVDDSFEVISVWPHHVTTESREIISTVQFTSTALLAADNALIAILKGADGSKLGHVVFALQGDGRSRIVVRVPVNDGASLTPGTASLLLFVAPTSKPKWGAGLAKSVQRFAVHQPSVEMLIAEVEPSVVHTTTRALNIRVGLDAFFTASGATSVRPIELLGDVEVTSHLLDSDGVIVGSGRSDVRPTSRYCRVTVSVVVAGDALPGGNYSMVAFLTSLGSGGRLASEVAVASTQTDITIIEDSSQPFISFQIIEPPKLTAAVNEVTVTLAYRTGASREIPFSASLMASGDDGKYGKQQVDLVEPQGTVTLSLAVDTTKSLKAANSPLTLLAFIAPQDTPQFSSAVAKARYSLPRVIGTVFEVHGATLLGRRKGHSIVAVRIAYTVDADPALSQVAIIAFAQFDGVMAGNTHILVAAKSTGEANLEIVVSGEAPAPGTHLSIVVIATPSTDRTFGARFARQILKIGTDFPRYVSDEHFVRLTHSLQGHLWTTDNFVTVFVEYNINGISPLLLNGSEDLPPGHFSMRFLVLESNTQRLLGSTEISPTDRSGLVPVTLEFAKEITAGWIEIKAILSMNSEVEAKLSVSSVSFKDILKIFATPLQLEIQHIAVDTLQVARVVPPIAVAEQETLTIDVMYNVTSACESPSDGYRCVIRVKAQQGSAVMGVHDYFVQSQRLKSMETLVMDLRGTLEVGVDMVIHTDAFLLASDSSIAPTVVISGPTAQVPVVAGQKACTTSQPAQQKKNILFLMVDDLGTQLGAYGDASALTPNMDALASRGIRFDQQFVDQPTCVPARVAMLSGLRCTRTGQEFGVHVFRNVPGAQSAAQIFMNAGYATYTFGKVFHYRTEYVGTSAGFNGGRRTKYINTENNDKAKPLSEFSDASPLEYTDGQVAREAIAVIEKHKRTREPFWLAVGFNKPHVPFSAPKMYKEAFSNVKFPLLREGLPLNVDADGPASNRWADVKAFRPLQGMDYSADVNAVPKWHQRAITLGYKATTAYSDDMLGSVVEALGCLSPDTHIIVWGDQGWHLGEQGLWGKNTMFDAVLKSPLIVVPAGFSSVPVVQSTVVESVDILPTMMEMVGIDLHDAILDGRSLVPLFDGMPQKRAAYSVGARGSLRAYSIRTPRYRYTEWIDLSTCSVNLRSNMSLAEDMHITTLEALGATTVPSHNELYDFAQSTSETENVAGYPERVRTVRELAELLRVKSHGPRSSW